MIGKKFRIAIFASSPYLKERVKVFTKSQQDEVFIYSQGLDDAIPFSNELERNKVEVIISRRGTAHLLRENLQIPVLSFPHRSLDILLSLKAASTYGRTILFTVFRQFMSGLEILNDILNITVIQKIYDDKSSMRQAIATGKREGCEVVVGGGVTQHFAEKIGLTFIEIRTSDEDIAATIENARSVALASREQRAMASRYRSIIDAASDGILAADDRGCITTMNAAARDLLRIPEKDAMGRPVAGLIPDFPISQTMLINKPVHDRLITIKEDRFIFNNIPILMDDEVIGAVSTFRDIRNVMRSENEVRRSLSRGLAAKYTLDDLVYTSPIMQDIVELAKQFAKTDSSILLIGETGTGKEIFAHGIHALSQRFEKPLVSINCVALPEHLLESELFGHEEGAFTGSKRGGKPGLFEIAHQGTVFLDEIDSTPKPMQIRLLRVLQEKEVMRIGGDRQIPVNVRVIAAANRDLGAAIREGSFRTDLFFRLNVLSLQIPPLRRRPEDVPVLLDFFIQQFSTQQRMEPIQLPHSYLARLMRYEWPGNVRQLRNFAERLVMNCSLRYSGEMLEFLYSDLLQHTAVPESPFPGTEAAATLHHLIKQKTVDSERQILLNALQQAKYHKGKTAERLGISRTTLWRKIKEMRIE